MYNRLLSFVNKHSLFYKYQFGKGHSTNFAMLTLIDKISQAVDEGSYLLGFFRDLSKAFETVNQSFLCKKIWDWRDCTRLDQNYLSDRSQYVEYINDTSEMKPVTCGVAQDIFLIRYYLFCM